MPQIIFFVGTLESVGRLFLRGREETNCESTGRARLQFTLRGEGSCRTRRQINAALAAAARIGATFTLTTSLALAAQIAPLSHRPASQNSPGDRQFQPAAAPAEEELQTGIALTKAGRFAEAIPHFLAARGRVQDEYALNFNLALCYVGTQQFPQAIETLTALRRDRPADANVENLLAQSYIGAGQREPAMEALEQAAKLAPKNEKLYLFVADACGDRADYELGLRVIAVALRNLPESARLHYQRGYFLAMLDRFDDAKPEFDRAASLAPQSEVAFLAAAQKQYFAGNLEGAIRATRSGIREGHEDYLLLTILGDALLRSGATPGTSEFQEARAALEKAVALRPGYATAQIGFGSALALDGETAAAVEHFEKARQLDPRNPAVYSHLAVAYRKLGQAQQADAMLATLAQLNADEAAKIYSAPGERKAIPGASATPHEPRP